MDLKELKRSKNILQEFVEKSSVHESEKEEVLMIIKELVAEITLLIELESFLESEGDEFEDIWEYFYKWKETKTSKNVDNS